MVYQTTVKRQGRGWGAKYGPGEQAHKRALERVAQVGAFFAQFAVFNVGFPVAFVGSPEAGAKADRLTNPLALAGSPNPSNSSIWQALTAP